jgi:hypothetical protein
MNAVFSKEIPVLEYPQYLPGFAVWDFNAPKCMNTDVKYLTDICKLYMYVHLSQRFSEPNNFNY